MKQTSSLLRQLKLLRARRSAVENTILRLQHAAAATPRETRSHVTTFGVDWLDVDHLIMSTLTDELTNRIREGMKRQALMLLSGLTDEARAHFAREERDMTRFGYPFLERHKHCHEHLLTYLECLSEDVKQGLIVLDERPIGNLTIWSDAHVAMEDQLYVEYASHP